MDPSLLAVTGVVVLALAFDYANGFHDAANAVSTIVATEVLRPRWAVAYAAVLHFVAFLLFGTAVASTVADTIEPSEAGVAVVFSALVGAVVWNLVTWALRLPSSSSHAIIGGLVGAGVAAAGTGVVHWGTVGLTAAFIVVAPVLGAAAAALFSGLAVLVERASGTGEGARGYEVLQLVSSGAVSLGHGTNDAQKTMGIIAALLVATGHLASPGEGEDIAVPLWVVLCAHAAIALGTLSGGWRIVQTMGLSITELRPASGFSAEAGAATSIFTATALGAPVSTTHVVGGAITGTGLVTPGHRADLSVARRMLLTWAVTIPASAVMAAGTYALTTLSAPVAVVGLVLAVAAAGYGVRRTAGERFGARQVEQALRDRAPDREGQPTGAS